MDNKLVPIFLAGNATVGKDTLFLCLQEIFKEFNIDVNRWALADKLKIEINDFTKEQYGISSFTKDIAEKTLIRDLMVSHGKIKRKQSQGTYWTQSLTPNILENLKEGELPVVCDVRYDEYPKDELYWAKEYFKGIVVYIERILPDGQLVPPANNDEKDNNVRIKEKANFILKWPTTELLETRLDFVKVQLKSLIKRIIDLKYGN